MNAEKTSEAVTELFEQAMKNYEQALKSGLKLQEESAKYWKSVVTQGVSPQEWQTRVQTVARELIPQSQQSLENCLKLIEENNRTGVALLKKAAEVAQSSTVEEAQSRVTHFWEASLGALNKSAQVATEANNTAIKSWVDFLTKQAATRPTHKTTTTAGAKS